MRRYQREVDASTAGKGFAKQKKSVLEFQKKINKVYNTQQMPTIGNCLKPIAHDSTRIPNQKPSPSELQLPLSKV